MLLALATDALRDFCSVAALAGATVAPDQIHVAVLTKPHKAKALPNGTMAIYCFFLNERALKVGKAGPNSGPRFTYQHYNGSAPSTLAGSILANQTKLGLLGLDTLAVRDWIKANTDRVDFIIPSQLGVPVLSLLEAFLHVRWKPMFEGRAEPL